MSIPALRPSSTWLAAGNWKQMKYEEDHLLIVVINNFVGDAGRPIESYSTIRLK